jgi:hypothetical protein
MSKKLFRLIKSLLPNEKVHFKKVSSIHVIRGQNTYIKLFDVIEKMEEYDALFLREVFQNQKTQNEISAYTNYLFGNILDSLKIYHARKTKGSEIRQLLLDVEILFAKQLYTDAKKTLDKAKAASTKYERWLLMTEIIKWELKLARRDDDLLDQERSINSSHSEQLKIAKKLQVSLHYEWLESASNNLLKQLNQHLKSQKVLNKMEAIIKDPMLLNEEKAISLSDKNIFYNIHAGYNFIRLTRDINKSIEYTNKRKELMENNIEWASQGINVYLIIFNNLLASYLETFNIEEFDKLLVDLKKMPERFGNKISEKDENTRVAQVHSASVFRWIITGEFEKGLSVIRGKEAEWEKIIAKEGTTWVLAFYDNIRTLFFAVQNYKKALFWNNKIINEKNTNPDIYSSAVIWSIIIHYEIGNFELSESLTKSAIRKVTNEKIPHRFEQLFLNNMQCILNETEQKETGAKKAFSVFKNELAALKRKGDEINELDYFIYAAWVDSHIFKIKYSEAYKKYLVQRTFKKERKIIHL